MPTGEYEFDKYLCETSAKISDIRLLADYCLVERLPEAAETKTGLHIPDSARDSRSGYKEGIVLAVGPGDPKGPRDNRGGRRFKSGSRERIPMEVCVGDRVMFSFEPQNKIKIEGRDMQMCHEEQHILAILEESEPNRVAA